MGKLLRESLLAKLKTTRPEAVTLTAEGMVLTSLLMPEQPSPLVISPATVGLDPALWAKNHLDFLETKIRDHGCILMRGFEMRSLEDFVRLLKAIPIPLIDYHERSSPRTELSSQVYTSTEFPADQTIQMHNELSYATSWPMKIWFFCHQPARRGGSTPIADVRRVYQRLRPPLRARFEAQGWMLVRNFNQGVGLSWRQSFRVESRGELESYCKQAQIDWEWLDGERLRTRQLRPAVAIHPWTGEQVWFNHAAFWHVSNLAPGLREALLREYGEEGLPYNTYYGDGERIEDEVIAELRSAYEAETARWKWEQGDVLMLDNMLVAHGREAYEGERRVLVAMGQPQSREELPR